jgi:hypothetical protein
VAVEVMMVAIFPLSAWEPQREPVASKKAET